ncbi:MAG: type IV pilus modification PilV family protein [Candidatus Binataceae bacterium]
MRFAADLPAGRRGWHAAFTLLEVMIAVAFVGIAMLALLALHHQNLQSVVRAKNLTKAAMLAQGVMTEAEIQRFPDLGTTKGDFSKMSGGQYVDFKWQRIVAPSAISPDIRQVTVRILYGPAFRQNFQLVEFMHNPAGPGNLAPAGRPGLPSAAPLGQSAPVGAP